MPVPQTAYVKFPASNNCVIIVKRERYECSTKANEKKQPFLLHRHVNLPCSLLHFDFPRGYCIYLPLCTFCR